MDLSPKPLRVTVPGGEVAVYIHGDDRAETLLCLNGGSGVSSRSMRRAFAPFAARGFRVVVHDQLGTGASDRPDDPGLWTLRRYVAEVDAVRAALGCDTVNLLGHSWGGWLAIEYAVNFPERLKSVIFSCTAANMNVHLQEIRRLLSAFGTETLDMIDRIEREGELASPLYKAICALFYARHSSRNAYLQNDTLESESVNMQIQEALWGPAEFSASGEMAKWNRLPDLHRIGVPALVLVGAWDYLTPRSAALIASSLPDARMRVFAESGHMPYLDEPEAYFHVLERFLRDQEVGKGR
jgi:proline iminopeptidase